MRPRARTSAVLALLALAVICAALVFSRGKPNPRSPLPVPNGYDTFVQAAIVVSDDPSSFRDLDLPSLRILVATNIEALGLVRTGLTQRCIVPLDMITNSYVAFSSNLLISLPGFKRIAFTLAAEGRLSELDGRSADAVRSYVECVRFGNEISRGGPLISRLVGIACEAIGYQQIVTLLPELGSQEMAGLATSIDEIRRASVPWEEIWQTEWALSSHARREYGPSPYWILAWWQIQPAKRRGQEKDNRIVAQLSLLSTELALRCYFAEHGKPPATLKEVTPKCLKDVPPDPFSKRPLIYQPQGTNWLLYSVGPDLKDDGGVPIKKGSPRTVKVGPPLFSDMVPAGDLFYDSMW